MLCIIRYWRALTKKLRLRSAATSGILTTRLTYDRKNESNVDVKKSLPRLAAALLKPWVTPGTHGQISKKTDEPRSGDTGYAGLMPFCSI